MFQQVGQAFLHRRHIFRAQIVFLHAAVVFQGAHCGHHYGGIGFQFCQAAFDVAEFFRAQIRAESCFGHGIIAQMLRQTCCQDGIAAVRDIGKRATMHKGRAAGDGLH